MNLQPTGSGKVAIEDNSGETYRQKSESQCFKL